MSSNNGARESSFPSLLLLPDDASPSTMRSLVMLALDETVKSFLSGKAFSGKSEKFFQSLKPEIVSAFFTRIPIPTNENLETIASFIESDDYWKRACNPKGHKGEEHGFSYKRNFFELHVEHIFEGVEKDEDSIIRKLRQFSDCIFTLKLSAPRGDEFPFDIVCKNMPNLMNINLKNATSLELKSIASSPLLTTLLLTESQLNDDDIVLMVDSLADSCVLLHLDLSHNKISSKGTKVIAEKLVAPSESILSCLDLSGNRISSKGASILGKAIATNESLLTLTLRMNKVGDEGGKELFEVGLTKNIALRHLNISANMLASDSSAALLKVLEVQTQDCGLESIILTSNSFSEEELKRLGQCQACFLDLRTSYEPTIKNCGQ